MSRKTKGTPLKCRRCFTRGKAPVRKCCGWATCDRCANSGKVDARRGTPLCRYCVQFREDCERRGHLAPGSMRSA